MKTEQEKAIIELSSSFEEANNFLEQKLGLLTTHRKIEYLVKNFDVQFVGHSLGNSYDEYVILLSCILDKKWM